MEKKVKTSDKVYIVLKKFIIIAIGITLILLIVGRYFDIQAKKLEKQQAQEYAMSKMPTIEERLEKLKGDNPDIVGIKTYFEYDGTNFIELYVADTWLYSTDIQQMRFASDVRDNVKAILFEEGFIKADDRVGIYVYSYDGISLAESKMNGEIKLK